MIVRLFKVINIADCEGKPQKVIARFSNEEAALIFAKSPRGCDMYGQPGWVKVNEFDIFDTAAEVP